MVINFFKIPRDKEEAFLYYISFTIYARRKALEDVSISFQFEIERFTKEIKEGAVYSKTVDFPKNVKHYSVETGNTCTSVFKIPLITPTLRIFETVVCATVIE